MFIMVCFITCAVFIFNIGIFVGMYLSADIIVEQEPCKSCEYTEGSEWCIKHCPHDADKNTEPYRTKSEG